MNNEEVCKSFCEKVSLYEEKKFSGLFLSPLSSQLMCLCERPELGWPPIRSDPRAAHGLNTTLAPLTMAGTCSQIAFCFALLSGQLQCFVVYRSQHSMRPINTQIKGQACRLEFLVHSCLITVSQLFFR